MRMDADEERLLGRKRKRVWVGLLLAVPFVIAMAAGVWFFLSQRRQARERAIVEQVTGAAFGCVASIRGDAPEIWGLERALEHMSRMERVTRDDDDDDAADERARFATLSADAARGCEELGSLMMRAHAEAPSLYFAVPAKLAQPPDQAHPERWFRRVLPQSRGEVLELTRQIRRMADAINARRVERELMTQELPIEGRGPSELAAIVELAPLPRELERQRTEVWPMPAFIFALRRGAIPRVPCETRHINLLSCYREMVQRVSWRGEPSAQRALERPARVSYWAAFAPTPDGSLWAVGADARGRGYLGRYDPEATTASVSRVSASIDASARLEPVAGGVALHTADGATWLAREGSLSLERVDAAPTPIVLAADGVEAARGLSIEGLGTLSVFGSEASGWTSRLDAPEGDDVLLRMLDAHTRVRAITSLRALRSGKAVALLLRHRPAPDAIAITDAFGRGWLSSPATSAE